MKRIYVLNEVFVFLEKVLVGVNEILVDLNLNEMTIFSDVRKVGEIFVQKIEVFISEVEMDEVIF